MALIKSRPKISLMIPRTLVPGQRVNATVVLDARRPVPVDFITVMLNGVEKAVFGSGQYKQTHNNTVAFAKGKLCGARELPAGRTSLPCSFDIPAGAPPSFNGSRGKVAYRVTVHASIPWWPDRRAAFDVQVDPPPCAAVAGQPALFSSAPQGYQGQEPYMEVSLADNQVSSAGVLRGAVALFNMDHNSYRTLRATLVGTEFVTLGSRQVRTEVHRYRFDLPLAGLSEGETIELRLRLPKWLQPTFRSSMLAFGWTLRLRAVIRWRSDAVFDAPVTVAPRPAGASADRAYKAPPSVGSERLLEVWRRVAQRAKLAFDPADDSLRGICAGARVNISREHRGRDGIFVVGRLEFDSLHLDLDLRPVSGLQRLGYGLELGVRELDRKYHVTGHDLGQVRALICDHHGRVKPLSELLLAANSAELDDRSLVLLWRGSGQNEARLGRITALLLDIAAQLELARQQIPAPAPFADAVDAWQQLARRLHGELELARMAVSGRMSGMPCEVCTRWASGKATNTDVVLRPPLGLSSDYALELANDDADEPDLTRLPRAAHELVHNLLAGALALRVTADAVQVDLEAPLDDPMQVVGQLEMLARLAALLSPDGGPYR